MKKLFLVLLMVSVFFRIGAKADEGMWVPLYIEKMILEDMQKLGLELTADQLFSLEQPSVSDAIVIFGRGCTGEIVSDKGLLLTNHHCGYGSIQSISTVENDILKNGFWAKSFDEEIPIPGLTVRFMVDISNVTEAMMEGITEEMTEAERNDQLGKNRKAIVEEAEKDNNYNASVREFFEGNAYYLIVYQTFRDIRLVGNPPESMGKFGADTDNWTWPRHTADFAFFRVYANAENQPASYSEDNTPYTPKHFLPVSTDGVQKDDFAMILGNPGSTDRYLSSWGVKLAVDQSNMTIVDIREEKLRIMKEGMDASDKVRLQYASKYAGVSNYWKYFIGQTRGLKRLKVASKKEAQEAAFNNWLAKNTDAQAKYGQALPLIESAYETIAQYNLARIYYSEAIARGSELLFYANRFNRLGEMLDDKEVEQSEIDKNIERLKNGIDGHFKNYDVGIDMQMLAEMLAMYYKHVPQDQQPPAFKKMVEKQKQDFHKLAGQVFDRSIFTSPTKVKALLNKPSAKDLEKDPALQLARIFIDWHDDLSEKTTEAYSNLKKGNRLFMAGLMEMQPEKHFYPNANFSMRITYGTVQDYFPADAVHYDYQTTMKGIMEKEDPSTWEFVVPEKLKEIYANKDFGPYGNPDGSMTVNILTNHDITGGNSGSPVINGKGHLIGLAFDGNWEAMSGDIAFEPEVQRTISVDARYILMIVDKFAGAQNLIDEMHIVSEKSAATKKAQAAKANTFEKADR
jgi:hypothetical protein